MLILIPTRAPESFWESQLFAAIIGALIPLAVLGVVEYRKKQGLKKEKAALLHVFAVESVNLFERFVQYCRQIVPLEGEGKPQISLSVPYEMMPASSIARLVEL